MCCLQFVLINSVQCRQHGWPIRRGEEASPWFKNMVSKHISLLFCVLAWFRDFSHTFYLVPQNLCVVPQEFCIGSYEGFLLIPLATTSTPHYDTSCEVTGFSLRYHCPCWHWLHPVMALPPPDFSFFEVTCSYPWWHFPWCQWVLPGSNDWPPPPPGILESILPWKL